MKKLMTINQIKQPAINNIDELHAEVRRISASVKLQEFELRAHLKGLPREAMKAGVGNVIPSIINSKVAGIALTAGSALLGNYFLPKAAASTAGVLSGTLKKAGLATIGEMALKWIFKRRKK